MITDPRLRHQERVAEGLTVPNTDKIDSSKAQAFVDEVTMHLTKEFVDQIWYGNVHDIVNNYVFYCFWHDIGPIECAQTILNKVGAK